MHVLYFIWVGGSRSKERNRKSELVLRSTYQTFDWDRNNSDRSFYNVVRCVHIQLVPWMQERSETERRAIWPCLNVATWRRERSDRAIQQIRWNSTAFHSIPAIRSKGSTSVLSTRKIRPIYSHTLGNRLFRQIFHAQKSRIIWFCFWFSINWLGPNQKQNQDYIPVCRILELKKNDKTISVGMMQSIKGASDMSSFPLVLRGPLGPLIFPYR